MNNKFFECKKDNLFIEYPLITIITVVYNGEKTIEHTINSVINQTYKNIEYIIIDGGSTDSTKTILKKYESKIDYWVSERDKGIYDAMNKGIQLSHGDYISLLNADDYYEPFTCEIIANEIKKEKYDVYHGIQKFVNEDLQAITVFGSTILNIKNQGLAHQTCFVSKEVYKDYKYDISYKSAADYDFMCRLCIDGKSFKYIDKVLVNDRLNGMSSTPRGIFEHYLVQYRYHYISVYKFIFHLVNYKVKLIRNKIKIIKH